MENSGLQLIESDGIRHKIYMLRDVQVMLDEDLARLYQTDTKRLNEQVRRNKQRFPKDYCFKIGAEEYENLKSQFATSSLHGGRRKLPYAFTEQGVAMLSAVLKSDVAVYMSIKIINTFVEMRRTIANNTQLFARLDNVEQKQLEHKIETDKKFDKAHDRFLVVDDKFIYHFGASLKDLGAKWFAISRFDTDALDFLGKLL